MAIIKLSIDGVDVAPGFQITSAQLVGAITASRLAMSNARQWPKNGAGSFTSPTDDQVKEWMWRGMMQHMGEAVADVQITEATKAAAQAVQPIRATEV